MRGAECSIISMCVARALQTFWMKEIVPHEQSKRFKWKNMRVTKLHRFWMKKNTRHPPPHRFRWEGTTFTPIKFFSAWADRKYCWVVLCQQGDQYPGWHYGTLRTRIWNYTYNIELVFNIWRIYVKQFLVYDR